jgi:hypothetical protein
MTIVHWNSQETMKCPPGSTGYHRRYGLVRVLRADGWYRVVEVRGQGVVYSATGAAVSFPERVVMRLDVRELVGGPPRAAAAHAPR